MDLERAGLWTGVGIVVAAALVLGLVAAGVVALAEWLDRRSK